MITVAISDDNIGRRTKFEHFFQGEKGIRVLTNAKSNEDDMLKDRRLTPRTNITAAEDMVAKVRRLSPRVLFANIKQCLDADCALLVSLRRECPQTLVVLIGDDSDQQEDQVIQALESGARGYLSTEADLFHFSKAVHVIDRGEVWVPRKMIGKIMDSISQWYHQDGKESHLDPAS